MAEPTLSFICSHPTAPNGKVHWAVYFLSFLRELSFPIHLHLRYIYMLIEVFSISVMSIFVIQISNKSVV